MLEITLGLIIPFIIVIIGTTIAGLWDLFTTEVPDEISFIVIISSVFYWILYGLILNNFTPLLASITLGTIIFGAGWLLYIKGKWGGADALILASIFYAIPIYPIVQILSETSILFTVNYFINLLIVSLGYMVLYTIILGIRNPEIVKAFKQDIKKTWKIVIAIPATLVIAVTILVFFTTSMIAIPWEMSISILLLMVFWRYAVVIETKHFTRKIPITKLKIGDVLMSNEKWVGITKEELEKLKQSNKSTVIIKEGVRFAPVFAITLAVTFILGNVLFYLLL